MVRGEDGLTPWARVRGRPFGQQLLGFGEAVLHKLPGKGPESNPDGNMGTRWRESTFVGYSRSSNTYLVINDDGVHQCRSLRRRPMSERWRPEDVAAIKHTPWSERDRTPAQVQFQEPAQQHGNTADVAAPAMPKRFRINQSDLEAHGYTTACPQCTYIQKYGRARPGGVHSLACRARVIEEIRGSEAGRA